MWRTPLISHRPSETDSITLGQWHWNSWLLYDNDYDQIILRSGLVVCILIFRLTQTHRGWGCSIVKNMPRVIWNRIELCSWESCVLFMDPWVTKKISLKTWWNKGNLTLSRTWDSAWELWYVVQFHIEVRFL